MSVIQTIHLRVADNGIPQSIDAVQGDTDRSIKMIIDDMTLTSGLTGKIAFRRPDDTHYEADATLDVSTNSFTASLDQALTCAGKVDVQLKITDTNVVSTFAFAIIVEKDASGIAYAQEGISFAEAVQAAERAEELAETFEDVIANSDKTKFSLGFDSDGLLYIYYDGVRLGLGINIENASGGGDGSGLVTVFQADFSGEHPSANQFYSWEGREYGGVVYDSMSNINIVDGVLHLTAKYNSGTSKWIEQMITTGGLFEADEFTCSFRAKFENIPGAWQNVITYGTGTHWTNSMYSDGVKWPAGGEIDAFEQAGGYSATPNKFTPTFHYGSGTNSGYPNTHEFIHVSNALSLPVGEWADYQFSLKDGKITVSVNGTQVASGDGSNCIVNNNYLWNYKPFLKPQAFYLDGQVAASGASTSNEYDFQISDFKIKQAENVECTGLEIYPQMWEPETSLTFPTNAEFYLDRVYTPANTSNKACTWSSSNTSVATVVQGLVKTVGTGTAIITATCGSATATYTVNVSSSASIPCAGLKVVSVGTISSETVLTYYKYPSFTTNAVSIVSSDQSVVTIDGNTLVPVGNGTANITVTCGSISETIEVGVTGISNVLYPFIEYDFEDAADNYLAKYNDWDGTASNYSLISTGDSDAAGVYLAYTSSSGSMNAEIKCQTENALIAKTETFAVYIGNIPEFIQYATNNPVVNFYGTNNHNHMPSIRCTNGTLYLQYGAVNGVTPATTPDYVIMGHDASGYYLYYDGEIKNTGTGTGYIQDVKGISSRLLGTATSLSAAETRYNFLKNLKLGVFKADRNAINKILNYYNGET